MDREVTTRVATDPAIEIVGLTKVFGDVRAVQGIDLQVARGEVFGFLGPNGAGKSTTIRCVLGMLRPTDGSIRVLGIDARAHGPQARRRIAYVPGELRLPERVTAGEFITGIGRLRGGFGADKLATLAARLRLDLGRPIRELSTGNRRKVALVAAFLADAELLILDEPTSGLDPLMQREFLSMVREVRDAGATVFLSSHVLSEIQRVADRVAILRAGRLVGGGSMADLRRRTRQRVEVWFDGAAPAAALGGLPDLEDLSIDGDRMTATVSGPLQPLLGILAAHPVTSMVLPEPDLEDAFLDLYDGAA